MKTALDIHKKDLRQYFDIGEMCSELRVHLLKANLVNEPASFDDGRTLLGKLGGS